MEQTGKRKYEGWLYAGLLVVAVLVTYSKLFGAGFTAWDDTEYILHNKDVFGITAEHIGHWFSRIYIGNYHPLTIFSYAIDFALGGTDAFVYHLTNILLHAANAVLLFLIFSRIQQNKLVAFFVALIFAMHPSQTESVSWIAERKTVLCAFFYLLAILVYLSNIEKPTFKKMLGVALLGLAAMLSKGIGVALPVALLAVDMWKGRDLKDKKVWLEKIPLLVLSLVLGIVAIKAQAVGKFLNMHPEYNWFDTIVFAGYAYVQYIVHLLVPVQLSVIYPYPHEMGFLQYFFAVIALGIIVLGFFAYKKKWYVLCGGILFYTVNIVLVLQFVQFGEFLMADRYLYIANIGILFPIVYYLFYFLQKEWSVLAVAVSGVAAAVFLVVTFNHNDIWLSQYNFFTSILTTFPNSAVAQYSVGGEYLHQGNFEEAMKHTDIAIQLDPNSYKAWYNKGVINMRQRKYPEALAAFDKSIEINDYRKALFSRALIYQESGKPEQALPDIEKVLADDPNNARAYYIKAGCLEMEGNMPEAVTNYSKAIEFEDNEPLFYIRRGVASARMKQNDAGLKDLDKAVSLNPENGEAFYFRGIVKYHAGMPPCADFQEAVNKGYKQAAEALARVCNSTTK